MPTPTALAFVDLETTGANPENDRITEVGLVLVDPDGQVREWSQLVNPGQDISPFIEQLTGINNAMVADAPPFADLCIELLALLKDRLFIAHNARFDYGFLKAEFARAGHVFRAPTLCTVKLSRKLFPQHPKHNLDALMARHGLVAENRHRALTDARLIHQFWNIIQQNPGVEQVEKAMLAQLTSPSIPPNLDPTVLEDIPEGAGVYVFLGPEGEALQVGRARNLRKQIFSHFASPKHLQINQSIHALNWQECAGDVGAQLLESAWVKRLRPQLNRHLKAWPELCTWRLEDQGQGWIKPRLCLADEQEFSLQAPCYGLYKTLREAKEALRAMASELRLCDCLLGLETRPPGQPCSGVAQKRCKGACLGKESMAQHSTRLLSGMTRVKLQAWPFPGPALLQEGAEAYLVDGWRYLGSLKAEGAEGDIHTLLEAPRPSFDKDIYRILVRHLGRFQPLS